MVDRLPRHPINRNENQEYKSFSSIVIMHMKSKGITQTDLVKLTALSKTTVSRICRNSNDKGCTYVPKRDVVMAVSVGLGLTPEEADALFLAAFPEEKIWRKILAEHMNIDQANEILYDNGLPLLGSMKDE